MGEFNYASQLASVQCLALVAGGSGATPFFRIIERWLEETPPSSSPSSVSAARALSLVVVDRASPVTNPATLASRSPVCHTMHPSHAALYVRAARHPLTPVPKAADFLWWSSQSEKPEAEDTEGKQQAENGPRATRSRGAVDMRAVFVVTPPSRQGAAIKTDQTVEETRAAIVARSAEEEVVQLTGQVLSDSLLAACLPPPTAHAGNIKVLVCGPPQFNAITARALVMNGFDENQLFIFR